MLVIFSSSFKSWKLNINLILAAGGEFIFISSKTLKVQVDLLYFLNLKIPLNFNTALQ